MFRDKEQTSFYLYLGREEIKRRFYFSEICQRKKFSDLIKT